MVNRVADQSLTTDHRTGQSIPPIGRGLTTDHCAHQGTDYLLEEGGFRGRKGAIPVTAPTRFRPRYPTAYSCTPSASVSGAVTRRRYVGVRSGHVPVTPVTPVSTALMGALEADLVRIRQQVAREALDQTDPLVVWNIGLQVLPRWCLDSSCWSRFAGYIAESMAA